MRKTLPTLLFCFAALIAQAQQDTGRVTGIVVDKRGHPLSNMYVHLFREDSRMFMPTAVTNETGRFVVEQLQPGTYEVFAESETKNYPDTSLSFYSKEEPIRIRLGEGESADVKVVIGPHAGVLSGIVVDRSTGKPVVSPHAVDFVFHKTADPNDSIEFTGPSKFRWLLPPGVGLTFEVRAEGYHPWFYGDPSDLSGPLPLQFESGENKKITIELDRESKVPD